MTVKSRLQIYTDNEIKGRVVIVGERVALKELSRVLSNAADSPAGFDSTNLYRGDGHDYEILVTKNVSEQEWQEPDRAVTEINFVYEYDRLKKTLIKEKL